MLYEAVIVLDSSLSDADVASHLDKVEAIIANHADESAGIGKVTKRDVWGRRQLAYKINKKEYGIYAYLVFSGTQGLVADLRRQLRINDSVLRFLVVKKDKFAPDLLRPPVADTYGSGRDGFRDQFYGGRDNYFGGRESFGSDRDGGDVDLGVDIDAAV